MKAGEFAQHASPTIDPVCGMTVDPASTAHHAEHDGLAYFFCSARCREKFIAEPAKYLFPADAPPAPAGTIYTCPMHPEIRQEGPGTCPICGMALEPEMPSLDDDDNPELRDFSRRFWWTLPLSIATMLLAMFGHRMPGLAVSTRTWLEFAMSTPVVLWAGWPFFERCIASIRTRNPNMFTLIGIGVANPSAHGQAIISTATAFTKP